MDGGREGGSKWRGGSKGIRESPIWSTGTARSVLFVVVIYLPEWQNEWSASRAGRAGRHSGTDKRKRPTTRHPQPFCACVYTICETALLVLICSLAMTPRASGHAPWGHLLTSPGNCHDTDVPLQQGLHHSGSSLEVKPVTIISAFHPSHRIPSHLIQI